MEISIQAVAVGADGLIYYTGNGGTTWKDDSYNTPVDFYDIDGIYDDSAKEANVWIIGYSGGWSEFETNMILHGTFTRAQRAIISIH